MREIWARVAMVVEVTDEEFKRLQEKAVDVEASKACGRTVYKDEYWDKELDRLFERNGKYDGLCYVPQSEWENY